MVTVVNLPEDTRNQELGRGLGVLAQYMYAKHQDNKYNEMADQVTKQINDSPDYDTAMKIYYASPTELRTRKGDMLRQAVTDRHPGFESIKGFGPDGQEKTVIYRKGSNPQIAAEQGGIKLEGPKPAWGVDLPGIGIQSAPDEQTAILMSETLKKAGVMAPILRPEELDIRQKSEIVEASVLNAQTRARGVSSAGAKEFELGLNARYGIEKANDPYANEAGVKVLIDTENDFAQNMKTRFGSTGASGVVTLNPGQESQFTSALGSYQALVRRGASVADGTRLAELSGRLKLEPTILDPDTETMTESQKDLMSKYGEVSRDVQNQYGVKLSDLKVALAMAANTDLPEYQPLLRGPEAIQQTGKIRVGPKPIPGQPDKRPTIIVIRVNGEAVPIGVSK